MKSHVSLTKKTCIGVLFCDRLRAYNCINHDILLLPFSVYAIQGKGGQQFESYEL
jgi:hypothetical protein